jgi:aryl-alcohol dehydrogenase-like predicted oxidoreductase
VLATCRDLGIGFVAYSPLGRGFLTGAIRSEADLDPTDGRRRHPRFQAANLERNQALAESVRRLAREKGCTAAQLALAWLLQRDGVVPIPGTKRRTYLDDNLGALDVRLTPAEEARIDAAFPAGAAAGDRYPESAMRHVHR